MLEALPILSKYIVIPNLTRDQDCIIRHTKPMVVMKEQDHYDPILKVLFFSRIFKYQGARI